MAPTCFGIQLLFTAEKDTTEPQWVGCFSLRALIKFKVGSGGVSGVPTRVLGISGKHGINYFPVKPVNESFSETCVTIFEASFKSWPICTRWPARARFLIPSWLENSRPRPLPTHLLRRWWRERLILDAQKKLCSLLEKGASGWRRVSLSRRCYAQGELVRGDKDRGTPGWASVCEPQQDAETSNETNHFGN